MSVDRLVIGGGGSPCVPRYLSQQQDTMKDSTKTLASLRKLMKDRR